MPASRGAGLALPNTGRQDKPNIGAFFKENMHPSRPSQGGKGIKPQKQMDFSETARK
jgi:hypothetical protein